MLKSHNSSDKMSEKGAKWQENSKKFSIYGPEKKPKFLYEFFRENYYTRRILRQI